MALLRAYRRAYAGLPREVWLLSAVIFINRCGTMVLPFLLLYLKSDRGYSAAGAGQMLAVYGFGAIAGAQLGGFLTQRVGGVPVGFWGLALSVPGFFAIPWCYEAWQIAAALAYVSVVFETIRPAISTATTEYCPSDRHTQAFGLNRLAMNLGMSIGPVMGGVLATIDYQLLFYVNGIFVALAAVMIGWSFGWRRHGKSRSASRPASGQSPWGDGVFLAYLGLQLLAAIVFFQLIGALPLYWKEQSGLTESQIGLLFVVNTLLIVVFEMVLTNRLVGQAPLRMVAAGTLLVGVGFGLSAFGDGFWYAVALALVWTLGEMLSAPFALTYVARRSEEGRRGAYMGMLSSTFAAALVISPLVGTWLYEIDPQLPWWCCLGSAVVLPVGFELLKRFQDAASASATQEAAST